MPPRGAKARKKGGAAVGVNEAADLLSAINSSSGLDEREVLRVIGVDKAAPCDPAKPCKQNKKDNVACFCQLVPADTSFRKKGLWQKDQAYLGTLGPDPVEQKREEPTHPAGLRNLGNTCYANAALQCLYSIPSLRNGVYGAEPRVASHDIFRQLQALFLELQFGPKRSVDTEALAKTLGLSHGIQQDGQEFLKLLLTRVEQMLSKSSEPEAKGLVQRLFRGGLSYVTTCQVCGRDSSSSSEVQDFYDLMPQVRGCSGLTESLAALLHADLLCGDNQYRCDFCARLVDAQRHVRLRALPPYLCLALQRFYFDMRTGDKAKALDKFAFPLTLDFTDVLTTAAAASTAAPAANPGPGSDGAPGASDPGSAAAGAGAAPVCAPALEVPAYPTDSPVYELVAILIHKGSQAHSGHYVAHIKDQASGQWWRYDDEAASLIGPDPAAAFMADHGQGAAAATAAGAAEPGAKTGGKRKRSSTARAGEVSDDDYVDPSQTGEEPEADDEEEEQAGARGKGKGRGKKRGGAGGARGRGRALKRGGSAGAGAGGGKAAGRGRSRGRGKGAAAAAADEDVDSGDELAAAVAASLAPLGVAESDPDLAAALAESAAAERTRSRRRGGGAAVGGGGGEDDELQAALAASIAEAKPAEAPELVLPPPPGSPSGGTPPPEVKAEAGAAEAPGAGVKAEPGAAGDAAAAATPSNRAAPTQIVSSNAYMLVYRAVGFQEPPPPAGPEQLPGEPAAQVAAGAAAFAEACETYERQCAALMEQVESRRRSVREVLALMPPRLNPGSGPGPRPASAGQEAQAEADAGTDATPPDGADGSPAEADGAAAGGGGGPPGFWVSTAWLEQWANDDGNPPPIDNSGIVCIKHAQPPGPGAGVAGAGEGEAAAGGAGGCACAGLDPAKVAAAKLVSAEAWSRLQAAHGGGPALAAAYVCRHCLAGAFSDTLLGSQAEGVRRQVAAILEASAGPDGGEAAAAAAEAEAAEEEADEDVEMEGQAPPPPKRYWVSRLWLQGWSKRQGTSVKAEKSPTADLVCPHAQLLDPSAARNARRVAVPRDVWAFLKHLWRQQRVREATEEATAAAAGAAAGGGGGGGRKGAGGRGRGRGRGKAGSAAAAATAAADVDCMDLTSDGPAAEDTEEPAAAAAAAAPAANAAAAAADSGDDDDVLEMTEPEPRGPRAPSAVPSSREATIDPEAPLAPSSAAAAAATSGAPPRRIPTPAELDALCPELPVGRVAVCRACSAAAGQAAEAQADSKRAVESERAVLGALSLEVVPTVEPGQRYHLVPSGWVREWQQYVKGPPKKAATAAAASTVAAAAGGSGAAAAAATPAGAPRPGPVTEAMLRVLCPCHPAEPRLAVPMPRLLLKRNKLCQPEPDRDALRLVPSDVWETLITLYGPPGVAGGGGGAGGSRRGRRGPATPRVAAQRAAARLRGGGGGGSSDDDVVMMEDHAPSPLAAAAAPPGSDVDGAAASDRLAAALQGFTAECFLVSPQPAAAEAAGAGTDGGGASGSAAANGADAAATANAKPSGRGGAAAALPPLPELRPWPPLCEEALAAAERAAKEAALAYGEAEVMVELIPEADLAAAFRDSGATVERKSRRSRKGRVALRVSNTTTLGQLKLQLFQDMAIHPRNQTLYVRGPGNAPRALDGDDLSLAQHEVLPGTELRLVRGTVVDDDADLADLLGDGGGRKRRVVEEGFKNTALHGDLPPLAQQAQQGVENAERGQGSGGDEDVEEAQETEGAGGDAVDSVL
ncbi:hypothetical protein HYH03_006217 [Edaphochlamys debaryana]|uniref:ubiquitinyl hydrolase 1 n=1 Tax=Edaphochlamys debaryana TaxID=47281 RepID=A0A835Y343_9CHLO|nr:hypothetical protein HYH03_006217 [Edaphochlamys debaryana]|eukprot:KAG2495617.1 hypothetical protein HYH03_006217 [Edaphochlamys debaryana]